MPKSGTKVPRGDARRIAGGLGGWQMGGTRLAAGGGIMDGLTSFVAGVRLETAGGELQVRA